MPPTREADLSRWLVGGRRGTKIIVVKPGIGLLVGEIWKWTESAPLELAHDSCKFFLFENPTSTWYSESLFILSEGYNWTGIYAATSGSLKDSKDYCLAQGKTREEKSVRSNRTRKCYSDLTFGTRYVLPMARPSVGSIIYKPKIFRENEGPSSRVHTPAARSCHPHQTNPPSTAHKPHSHHNYPSSAIPRPLPTSHPAS